MIQKLAKYIFEKKITKRFNEDLNHVMSFCFCKLAGVRNVIKMKLDLAHLGNLGLLKSNDKNTTIQ